MQGHVYKRGKSWTYVADAGRDPAPPARAARSSKGGFRTRKAAEAAMREYLHARESGQLTEHTSATVGEYLEQWLANQEPTARKTTFRGYKRTSNGSSAASATSGSTSSRRCSSRPPTPR